MCDEDSSVWFCVERGHRRIFMRGGDEGSDVSERWHPVGRG